MKIKPVSLVLGLCLVASMVLVICFRPTVALGLLYTGNAFFGGSMPYNLTIADLSFRAALLLDERVPDAWHQRARIKFLAGDFDEAQRMIDTQIEMHGDTFMAAYYIRGLIAGYDKRYREAEADFEHFLTWDPNNWAANNDLAWLYFAQGKFADVEERARIGLESNPHNPWLLQMYGMALFNLGDKEGAQIQLVRAKDAAALLTEADWHKAYPGNNPAAGEQGLDAFKATIERNLELVHK